MTKTAPKTARFGDLPIGTRFWIELTLCEKKEPRVCQSSRDFYAGKQPGYPGVSEFHDWNCDTWYMGRGEKNETSLAPDTIVVVLD